MALLCTVAILSIYYYLTEYNIYTFFKDAELRKIVYEYRVIVVLYLFFSCLTFYHLLWMILYHRTKRAEKLKQDGIEKAKFKFPLPRFWLTVRSSDAGAVAGGFVFAIFLYYLPELLTLFSILFRYVSSAMLLPMISFLWPFLIGDEIANITGYESQVIVFTIAIATIHPLTFCAVKLAVKCYNHIKLAPKPLQELSSAKELNPTSKPTFEKNPLLKIKMYAGFFSKHSKHYFPKVV